MKLEYVIENIQFFINMNIVNYCVCKCYCYNTILLCDGSEIFKDISKKYFLNVQMIATKIIFFIKKYDFL